MLSGYKTYIVAALTIVYAVGGAILSVVTNKASGVDPQTAINLVIAALFGTTFRSALKTQTGTLGATLADMGEKVAVGLADQRPPDAGAPADPARLHPDDIESIAQSVAKLVPIPGVAPIADTTVELIRKIIQAGVLATPEAKQ